MGNPTLLHPIDWTTSTDWTLPTKHNGILGALESEVAAEASAQLPPATAGEQANPKRVIEMDSPRFGKVRITFALRSHRHYRTTHWRWAAEWAEQVSGPKEKPPEGG